MSTRPNFLLIGSAKSGTTSLYFYLDQHPEIFMSAVKEIGFMVFEGGPASPPGHEKMKFIIRLEDYEALYNGVTNETAIGDASPQYLDQAAAKVIARIRRYLDDPRLIGVLRQPVDRGYSLFNMQVRDGRRPPADDFEAVMRRTFDDIDGNRKVAGRDRELVYEAADRVRLYAEAFEHDRLKWCLYDDLKADATGFMREIYLFLGVDPAFPVDTSIRVNRAGPHRSKVMTALLESPNPIRFAARKFLPQRLRFKGRSLLEEQNRRSPPALDPDVRRDLSGWFRTDIEQLQDLIGRDLAHWLR